MIATVVCIPMLLVPGLRGVALVGKVWSWAILKTCNVRVETEGLEHVDRSKGYLVLANHTNLFDAVILYRELPFPFRALAKRELAWIPVFGQVLQLGAAIIVDRGNRKKAIRSVERARRAINKGQAIIVFPEGTRTPEGELGSFKKGAFYLATEAEVPILPLGIRGAGNCMLGNRLSVRPGTIQVRFGKPVEIAGYPPTTEGRSALMTEVEARLRKLMC